jgi:hypothetical protein
MPFLKDSKAALSDGMQQVLLLLSVPVPPAPPVSHKVAHMMVRVSMGRGLDMGTTVELNILAGTL